MGLHLWLTILLITSPVQAEYRAFQLEIRDAEGQVIRPVLSNLDPEQYVRYYHVKVGEFVVYTDTWMCKGRTSEKNICPNPNSRRENINSTN